uniref:Uncharacterized protein n=1 Tax=Oryza brachyantha TaxID=4533 RepID=J3MX85_ORYBR
MKATAVLMVVVLLVAAASDLQHAADAAGAPRRLLGAAAGDSPAMVSASMASSRPSGCTHDTNTPPNGPCPPNAP